jgi:hypothetical protein
MANVQLKDGIEIVGLGKDGELEIKMKEYAKESDESATIVLNTIRKNNRFPQRMTQRKRDIVKKIIAVRSTNEATTTSKPL